MSRAKIHLYFLKPQLLTRSHTYCFLPVLRTLLLTHRHVHHGLVAVRARGLLRHAPRAALGQRLGAIVRDSENAVKVAQLTLVPARHALPRHLLFSISIFMFDFHFDVSFPVRVRFPV